MKAMDILILWVAMGIKHPSKHLGYHRRPARSASWALPTRVTACWGSTNSTTHIRHLQQKPSHPAFPTISDLSDQGISPMSSPSIQPLRLPPVPYHSGPRWSTTKLMHFNGFKKSFQWITGQIFKVRQKPAGLPEQNITGILQIIDRYVRYHGLMDRWDDI